MNTENKPLKPLKAQPQAPAPANRNSETRPHKLPARRSDDSSRSRQSQSN